MCCSTKNYFPEIKIVFLYIALKLRSVTVEHPVHYMGLNKFVTIDLEFGCYFSEILEELTEDVIMYKTKELEQ